MGVNKNKGITLIALVITIIILLILAGISISALTQTGLFGKAKQAEQKSKEAEQNQAITLGSYEKEINKYVAEELTSDKFNKVLNTTENTVLKDSKGNIFTVPSGFKVTNDATTVDKGIVIEDATGTATNGSQFVWIPVGTITKADGTTVTINLDRYTFADDENGTPTSQGDKTIERVTSDNKTYYYKELENSDKGNTVAKSITNFKNSVATNGGYYIGRYEARTTTARNDKENALTQITEKGTDSVYHYVTQMQAASQAQNMYNSDKFTSDLMNSYAWDTATLFAQSCGTNKKYSRQNRGDNTTLSSTGTITDVQCNIYDMAGNVVEWTTETSSISGGPCVYRGGFYNDSDNYTSSRHYTYTSYSSSNIGFRPLLYL